MIRAVWDDVLFQARLRPSALAVFGPAGPVAYRTLVHDIDALATELIERNLIRQDMVGIQLGISYLHLVLILALDRLSIPSMSLPLPDSLPPAPALREQFGVTAIIAANQAPIDPPCRWIVMPEQHRPKFGQPDAARLARLDSPADSVVRVTWSSGSTGGIKGSPMTRTVQAHRLAMRRAQRGFGSRTRYFTGMPFSPASGYAPALAVLTAGGAVILPVPGTDFVSLANALGVTVTSGAPNMLADLLGADGNPTRRLETMEFFQVVGAPLSSKLARDARSFLTPHVWIGYGSTEIDGVALADSTLCMSDPNAAGFVTPWVDAEIVDPADQTLPPGREGTLRLRGAHMVVGYYRDDAATRANFRDGWFYPGDLAVITDQGLLRIIGRAEDVIVRGGVSLSPLPLEEAIRALPGVRDVAVFALTGADGAPEIAAALVLAPGVDAQAIRAAAAAKLGAQAPTRVFMIDQLPRNANGKLLRRVLVERAQRTIAP